MVTLRRGAGVAPARAAKKGALPALLARHGDLLAILLAVGLGLLVRERYLAVADFPLNDGGMFYVMTRELRQAHYLLPAFTSYNGANGAQIPFAYPPLGFYLAGLVSDLLRIDPPAVFRILPLLLNLATVVAFCRLARTLLRSRTAAAIAGIAFALLPNSFVWMIMGGGLTRSLGLFFAVVAIEQFFRLYRRPGRWTALLAAAFSALTLLSHLEVAYFLGLSVLLLLLLFYGRSRRDLQNTVLAAVLAALLAAPWWATVLHRHGIGPFVHASQTGGGIGDGILNLALLRFSMEPFFPLLGALALLGAVVTWRRRERFLVSWLAIVLVLDARSSASYAALPLALLAGVAIGDALLPLVAPRREREPALLGTGGNGSGSGAFASGAGGPAALLGLVLLYAAGSALLAAPRTLGALSRDDRQAMEWAAKNTPPSSRFLIISGQGAPARERATREDAYSTWTSDRTSEWFPALAGRVSVMTVQGREWLAGWPRLQDEYLGVQKCADEGAGCIAAWQQKTGSDFGYVYVVKDAAGRREARENPYDPAGFRGCCEALRQSLLSDADYALVYDGPAATIFEQRRGDSPAVRQEDSLSVRSNIFLTPFRCLS